MRDYQIGDRVIYYRLTKTISHGPRELIPSTVVKVMKEKIKIRADESGCEYVVVPENIQKANR